MPQMARTAIPAHRPFAARTRAEAVPLLQVEIPTLVRETTLAVQELPRRISDSDSAVVRVVAEAVAHGTRLQMLCAGVGMVG
jgi:hypothetical protein